MSAARKTMLVIATALVIGGLALSFGAFASAGFNLQNLSTLPRDWQETALVLEPEEVGAHTSIAVRDASENVRFEQADGNAIEVVYWESAESGKSFAVSDEDGALVVEASQKSGLRGGVGFMMIDFTDRSTVVKVPRGFAGTIEAETTSGNVLFNDIDVAGDITAQTQSGAAIFTDVADAASISAKTQSGSCTAVSVSVRDGLEAQSSSGSVDLASISAGTFLASSSSGSVALADVDARTFEARSGSGNLHASTVAADSITLNTTSGSIDAASLSADDIAIESSSGHVEASIAGYDQDYCVDIDTSSGHVEAPRGSVDADKRVSIRTMSGGISLAFTNGSANERYADPSFDVPNAPAAPEAPSAPTA